MAAISGDTKAITVARFGCARFGATRFGFVTARTDVENRNHDYYEEDEPSPITWTEENLE